MENTGHIYGKKLFLFALEGTLFQNGRLHESAIPLLRRIREKGGQYLFLTNNSSLCIDDEIQRLQKLGILAGRTDFLTSAQATAWYLHQHHPGKKLYVCGTVSLKRELTGAHLSVTEDPDEAECIVMGFDTELSWHKLRDVCRLLQTRPLPYLATNPDDLFPAEFGFLPDCGSICDLVYRATGKRPIVIGKPQPLMPLLAMERTGIPAEQTCLVGDRPDTDVLCGHRARITTVLLYPGDPDSLASLPEDQQPDIVLSDLSRLQRILAD